MLKKGPHKNADHDDTILGFAAKYASISHKKVLLSSFAQLAKNSRFDPRRPMAGRAVIINTRLIQEVQPDQTITRCAGSFPFVSD